MQNLKIQGRLLMIFGLIIVIGVVITAWTVVSINNLDRLANTLHHTEGELNHAINAKNILKELEIAQFSYIISRDPEFLHEHQHHMADINLFLRNALIRTESAALKAILFEFERELQAYHAETDQMAEAAQAGDWAAAEALALTSAARLETMVAQMDRMAHHMQPQVDAQAAQSSRQVQVSTLAGGIALLGFLGLVIGAAVVLSRQVTQPILTLSEAVDELEAGRFDPATLRHLSTRTDEIGHLARSFMRAAEDSQMRAEALRRQAGDLRTRINQTVGS